MEKAFIKIGAWLTNDHITVQELTDMSQAELASKLALYRADGNITGWTLVGEAEVFITLDGKDKLILNKVDALKAELAKTQADAEAKCNQIRGMINNLLAIEFKPEVSE